MENDAPLEGFKKRTDSTFASRAIHAAQDPENWPDSKPLVLPINLSTTFKQDAPYEFAVRVIILFSSSYASPLTSYSSLGKSARITPVPQTRLEILWKTY